MSVEVHFAPYELRNKKWDEVKDAFGDHVQRVVEEYAPGISNLILHRQIVTPLDLERDFGLTGGNIMHGELSLDQIFYMRPVPGYSRYATPIENLYLCASAAHPGGGVTGLPGYLSAKQILKSRS